MLQDFQSQRWGVCYIGDDLADLVCSSGRVSGWRGKMPSLKSKGADLRDPEAGRETARARGVRVDLEGAGKMGAGHSMNIDALLFLFRILVPCSLSLAASLVMPLAARAEGNDAQAAAATQQLEGSTFNGIPTGKRPGKITGQADISAIRSSDQRQCQFLTIPNRNANLKSRSGTINKVNGRCPPAR